jgi:ribose 5-phosphate isomerase A
MQQSPGSDRQIKDLIGQKACEFVQDGMLIGLGSGTTAAAFIHALALKLQKDNLKIQTVATSSESETLANMLQIPCLSVDAIETIDITFDGADEIDAKKRLIKGAGGALLREKIIAFASKELIIMVEEKKCVKKLGKTYLPVEVVPFGNKLTQAHLLELGYKSRQRLHRNGTVYITDNHNFIYDIEFDSLRDNPEEDDRKIRSVPGVVETGFFFHHTGRIIVGKPDGIVTISS